MTVSDYARCADWQSVLHEMIGMYGLQTSATRTQVVTYTFCISTSLNRLMLMLSC